MTKSNPRHQAPVEHEGIRRQLEQLFGESLFGPWPELEQSGGKSWQRPRSRVTSWKTWLFRFSIVATSIALLWAGRALLRPRLNRSTDDQRANYAHELQAFINDGNLERASEFVSLVRGDSERGEGRALDPSDVQLDLIVSTEAALYRYFDADAKRVRRIQPFLEVTGHGSPLRQLAVLTIQSREERAARLADLERFRGQLPNKNESAYLLATALEARNDVRAAREAWSRSAQLGPAWLGQRFEQAWFELRQGNQSAAQRIAGQMVRVDPDSPWTRLAASTFALELSAAPVSIRGDAAAPRVTPVQIHFERLQQSIEAAKRGDHVQAKDHLAAASAAIRHEAPFLFDAFDWLMADGLSSLARALTDLPQWPRGSEIAASKLRRLSTAVTTEPKSSMPAVTVSSMPEPSPPTTRRRVSRSATK